MSNNHCLFSVIIPVFNNAQYIKQTLDSVFAQIDSDVEVIIINDGSTDKSKAVIQQAIDQYCGAGQIHFYSYENSGVSRARNRALDKAQGAWIGFIDGDDLWCPHFWKTIKPLIQQGTSDLIDFHYHYFKDPLPEPTSTSPGRQMMITDKQHDALYEVFRRSHWHIWSRVYRRELIGNHRFHVGRRYEDMMFTPWLYLEAKRILCLEETLYWYRDNAFGITRNIQPSDISDMVFALNQLIEKVATQPPSALPPRLITALINNLFNEIKGLHDKIYGFYNYSDETMAALIAASKLLTADGMPLKRRLHLQYPQLWKKTSRLRRMLRKGR